jgi:hypothetical protein
MHVFCPVISSSHLSTLRWLFYARLYVLKSPNIWTKVPVLACFVGAASTAPNSKLHASPPELRHIMMLVVDLTFGASHFLFSEEGWQISEFDADIPKNRMGEHSKRDVFTVGDWVRWDAADQRVVSQLGVSCSHQMVLNMGFSQCGCIYLLSVRLQL